MTRRTRKLFAYSAVLAVLLGVFLMYTRPDFVVDVANQVWACF